MYDLVFMCDANNSIGFGHTSRCINLAKYLLKFNNTLKIVFVGSYIKEVQRRIRKVVDIKIHEGNYKIKSKCVVIDALGNNNNPNVFPEKKYKVAQCISHNIIYICSGTEISFIPQDVVCIGYHPSGVTDNSPNIYWDLKYAPTLKIDKYNIIKRNKKNVLLALGGIKDKLFPNIILEAINKVNLFDQVDILLSPVNNVDLNKDIVKSFKTVNLHYDLKTISPLLSQSALIIATFGNLAYEALAHGSPLCLVATKKFQNEYGDLLLRKGLAYNFGFLNKDNKDKLPEFINKAMNDRAILSKQAKKLIDGNGIKRIAKIIKSYI